MGYTCKFGETKKNTVIKTKSVFSHLIRKAEKRKMSAKNYHMYALLQSTVMKLRQDNRIFEYKKSQCMGNCSDSEGTVDESRRPDSGKDLLDLDDFFLSLKSVGTR